MERISPDAPDGIVNEKTRDREMRTTARVRSERGPQKTDQVWRTDSDAGIGRGRERENSDIRPCVNRKLDGVNFSMSFCRNCLRSCLPDSSRGSNAMVEVNGSSIVPQGAYLPNRTIR